MKNPTNTILKSSGLFADAANYNISIMYELRSCDFGGNSHEVDCSNKEHTLQLCSVAKLLCTHTHTHAHTHTTPTKYLEKTNNRKRIMESQGLIICFQIIVRARAHTHTQPHTHTHKFIQRQENTKKRVETQYTRNSNSHAKVHPFTRKVKRNNK